MKRLEENVEIEPVEIERVGETSGMDGLSPSDHRTVIVVDDAVAVNVGIFGIARTKTLPADALQVGNSGLEARAIIEFLRLIGSLVKITVHQACGFPDLSDVGVLTVIVHVPADPRKERILVVVQRSDGVAVEGDVEVHAPVEIPGLDGNGVERQFQALVPHRADIEHRGLISRCRRNGR